MKGLLIQTAKQYLEEGPMSTAEIHSRLLDRYPRSCPSLNRLAMMLRGKPGIIKHKEATNKRTAQQDNQIPIFIGHTVWRLEEAAS